MFSSFLECRCSPNTRFIADITAFDYPPFAVPDAAPPVPPVLEPLLLREASDLPIRAAAQLTPDGVVSRVAGIPAPGGQARPHVHMRLNTEVAAHPDVVALHVCTDG